MNTQNHKNRGRAALALLLIMALVPAAIFASGDKEDESAAVPYYGRMRMMNPGTQAYGGRFAGPQFAEDFMAGGHILITGVADDSPASEAGLAEGDVILAVNGEMIPFYALPSLVEELKAGDELALNVVRPRAEGSALLTPEELLLELEVGQDSAGSPWIGISYQPAGPGAGMAAQGWMNQGMMGRRGSYGGRPGQGAWGGRGFAPSQQLPETQLPDEQGNLQL